MTTGCQPRSTPSAAGAVQTGAPVWVGDGDAVVHGYCDLTTRKTLVWWPDLWRLHTGTRRVRETNDRVA